MCGCASTMSRHRQLDQPIDLMLVELRQHLRLRATASPASRRPRRPAPRSRSAARAGRCRPRRTARRGAPSTRPAAAPAARPAAKAGRNCRRRTRPGHAAPAPTCSSYRVSNSPNACLLVPTVHYIDVLPPPAASISALQPAHAAEPAIVIGRLVRHVLGHHRVRQDQELLARQAGDHGVGHLLGRDRLGLAGTRWPGRRRAASACW